MKFVAQLVGELLRRWHDSQEFSRVREESEASRAHSDCTCKKRLVVDDQILS